MQIPVLIEPVADGFRARSGEPLVLSAEGKTREEALHRLRGQMAERIAAGAEIVPLEAPGKDNPWLRMAGIWKEGDPLVEEWKRIMEENRRAADADPDYL
jgi:hypothetical protein